MADDDELKAKLKEMIKEAAKLSKELASYLDDDDEHVFFVDEDQPTTGVIVPHGDATRANTRTRLPRKAWRDALDMLKKAKDSEKEALGEQLFVQLLSELLHEANHRKGIITGVAKYEIPEEENRNTVDLITALISLLQKIKDGKPIDGGGGIGKEDPAKWMTRIREIIAAQKLYRWENVVPTLEPYRTKAKHVQGAFEQFKGKLDQIRKDASLTAQQQGAAATKAYQDFVDEAGTDKGDLEKEFGMTWELDWNHEKFDPVQGWSPDNTFQGQPIP